MPAQNKDVHGERNEWLADRTMKILRAATDCDADECTRLLQEVGDTYNARGIYGTCYALAEMIRRIMFPQLAVGDGTLTGEMAALARDPDAPEDPESLWAAQFVTAYLNGDKDTTQALFLSTMPDPELHMGGIAALVVMAGDVCRQFEHGSGQIMTGEWPGEENGCDQGTQP